MAESTASETLTVHLNRAGLHSIEVPSSFATAESFVIELDNRGEATHVHLRLDEALSGVASLPTSNHYVRPGATTRVPISVHEKGPIGGFLTVATAYGSETEDIEITIGPKAGKKRVKIDERLIERSGGAVGSGSAPAPSSSARAATGTNPSMKTGTDSTTLLAGAALVVLLGIVLLFFQGIAIYVGALAVIIGLVAAAYLLVY